MSHDYTIRYTVAAETKLEAIEKAVAKMRTRLRLVAVIEAAPAGPPWWVVRLKVVEEDGPLVVTTDAEGWVTSIEDVPEDEDREGQPEFNGAFDAW